MKMIEPRELMAGNWVKDPYNVERQMTAKDVWRAETMAFYPIPLSPEVLKKCGFVERQESFFLYYSKEYIHVAVTRKVELEYLDEKTYAWIAGNTIVHLTFLHELQNLYFALTGTELNYQP